MQLSSILVILFGAVSTFASPTPIRNGEFVIDIQLHQDSKSASGRRGPGRVALTGNNDIDLQDCCPPVKNCYPMSGCTKCGDGSDPTPYCGYGGESSIRIAQMPLTQRQNVMFSVATATEDVASNWYGFTTAERLLTMGIFISDLLCRLAIPEGCTLVLDT
ncbi:hypothetical protein K440DRAFT_636067 [Wilcoxina mikolae CBS 423.85]|nr:hypothetical protein K440DRAFT_636067 [Wilcoxina mikolae CBS 423.85]